MSRILFRGKTVQELRTGSADLASNCCHPQTSRRNRPTDHRGSRRESGSRDSTLAKALGYLCIAILVQATLCMLWPGGVLAIPTHPVPYVTSISPVSAAPGGAQFTLTVNGVNFIATSTVNWGNTALSTTFVSSKKLTATVTAGLIASGGTGWITVTSPTPGGGTSNVLYLPVANTISTIHMVSLSSTVGSNPFSVGEGDFNGDGILDLAVSNISSGNVTILLGNGDGTFAIHGTHAVGLSPLGVTVADVNGDGHLDLVVGHDSNLGPSVLLGDGTGTFVLQAGLSVIANPERPMVADIDHDGRLDIVVGSFLGTGVYFYKGNGDGTFQTAVNIGGTTKTFDVAIGDFNEDGNLDIVASHEGTTNSMDIFLGNGDGTFQAAVVSTPIPLGWSIALADMNNDGHLDIVISSRSNGGIVALLGNGDGTCQAPRMVVASGSYQAITTGDLNDDGSLDIVGASNSTLQFIPGNGDGTFQTLQSLGTISTAYGVVLGNFATSGGLGVGASGSGTTFKVFLQTVSLSPSPVNFGSVGVGTASTAQTVTVTNNTSNTVTISGISFTGTNAADFSPINGCTTPLASAATCTVQVTFTPGAVGARSAVLNVADNAPANPQTVTVTGTGVAAPVAMLAPVGLVFPAQHLGTASSVQTVTLSNSGNAALNSISISISGTNGADFGQTNTCGTTVAASANCTISVRFTPSQVGAESASLSIADNAAGNPQIVPLSGTGAQIAPTITWANPAAIVSGTALSATQLNATAGGVAGTFVYTPPSGTVLAAGSHTLSSTFTPTDTATYTSATATVSLSVTSFNVSAPAAVVSAVPGMPASATITIPPLGGSYNGVVTLSATGLPAGATATFSPTMVTPGTTGATSTLTVTFPVSAASLIPVQGPWSIPTGLTSLAACCFFLRRKQLAKALRASLLLGALAGSLLTLTGCNGGFGAGMSAPQTIVVTVTGSSGALHVSTTVTFHVQ